MGYARLARPANLPTAAADILAGAAISGFFTNATQSSIGWLPLLLLVLASVLLYAGGVVLNDVFDLKIDQVERPERPIPSGLIPQKKAAIFGVLLLLGGILSAFFVNILCGMIASVLGVSIVLYDAFSKRDGFLGPLNMGICRGLNLALGMSIAGVVGMWWLAVIPLVYIFAITLISRGEVHGNNKSHLVWAAVLYTIVILAIVGVVLNQSTYILQTLPFLALFTFLVFRPLLKAYKSNTPKHIKNAVIAGVLSLVVLDAALAAGFFSWWYGLLLLLLLPLSLLLSKIFAVT